MSQDIYGQDYALTKRFFNLNDSLFAVNFAVPGMPNADYYVTGLNAYLADPTVVPTDRLVGWTQFTHGQSTYPAWTLITAALLGITLPPLTPDFPAFETKETHVIANVDSFVSFEQPIRVPHFIPANTRVIFRQKYFMLFYGPVTPGAGIIHFSFFG